jgi:16S rRNA (adenine1518-N6/adenine1519-N6)-dimethyltransferase
MAKRELGQNFLIDRRAPGRIVRALRIDDGAPVLEIGPGHGALTSLLIGAAGRVLAIEVDPELAERLRRRFDESRLHLVVGDVLQVDLGDALRSARLAESGLLIAGNLPYNISKPIVQRLVRERNRVDRAVLMFQREVAERLAAQPGGRAYGPMSVLAQLCFDIEILFHLPPGAFRPRPNVDSTVTRWSRRREFALDDETERRVRNVLAVCFSRRRRTLRNNLRAAFEDGPATDALLASAGLEGGRRPETLSPAEFLRLADRFEDRPA